MAKKDTAFIIDRIYQRLKELNMTPFELCKKAGIDTTILYSASRRKKPFTGFYTIMKFCRILKVEPEYFLVEDEADPNYVPKDDTLIKDLIRDNKLLKEENAQINKKYHKLRNEYTEKLKGFIKDIDELNKE